MNNRVWIYCLGANRRTGPLVEKEYLGTVNSIYLNGDFAAVLLNNRIQLHLIEGNVFGLEMGDKVL